MARPPFNPTAEQRRTLTALAKLASKRRHIDAETDRLIAEAAGRDIPVAAIAEAAQVTRKTVYRHLGHKM